MLLQTCIIFFLLKYFTDSLSHIFLNVNADCQSAQNLLLCSTEKRK